MSPPRALLLDFGSVVGISLFERHAETERQLGLPSGSLTWLGPLAPETDSLWQAMQRDEISEREYWAARARELGEAVGEKGWDAQRLFRRVRQSDPEAVLRPGIRLLIQDARRRGIRIGILSNELELFHGREFVERLRRLEHFDALVDASNTNILKPDVRAYALAADALNLPAGEILFVDDQFRNIAGAVIAGLQTQHFDLRDLSGALGAIAARLRLSVRPSP